MKTREKWITRKFAFDFPVEDYPKVIERLQSGPERFADAVAELPEEVLCRKAGEAWSIKQNLGHMTKVEGLIQFRLDDYEAGREELRPADMSNQRTEDVDFNSMPIAEILRDFQSAREQTLARLEDYPSEMFARSAFHRRLGVHKRLVDTLFFFAEHDGHHLATIADLSRQL